MQASIYKITPFDINVGSTIKFQWDGAAISQMELVVRENETRNIVYRRIISNDNAIWNYEFPIKAGDTMIDGVQFGVTNGGVYNAFLRVYVPSSTADNKWSDFQSLGTQFMCLETPSAYFSPIEGMIQDDDGNNAIPVTSWQFVLNYSQANGEKLKSYIITLYNAKTGSELSSTGLVYMNSDAEYTESEGSVEVKIRHTFNGFSDKTEYKVGARLETINGMTLDATELRFKTSIEKGDIFTKLAATNYPLRGGIEIKSNLVSIDPYFGDKNHVFYFGKNGDKTTSEYIDLRDNTLVYKDGYELPPEFTFAMIGSGFLPNEICLSIQDAENDNKPKMDLYYRIKNVYREHDPENPNDVPKCYMELKVYDGFVRNVYFSNEIDLMDYTDFAQVSIIREGHMYHVYLRKLDVEDDAWATTHLELTKYYGDTLAQFTYRNLLTNYMRYKDNIYIKDIDVGTNLNDITEYGNYITMTQAIAQSVTNKPSAVTGTFRMTVSKTSTAIPYKQVITYNSKTYTRNYYASSKKWTAWS